MSDLAAQVLVIAKAPVPGRVKTRLTPPFTPYEAAALAEAALCDTLRAVRHARVARRVIALAGEPGPWLPDGFEVVAQRGRGLDERIAAAMWDTYAALPVPVVLIGMDTPQVTPGVLEAAAGPLARATADAAFGPAEDGGFWLLGLRRPDPGLMVGVPMSEPVTGRAQLVRLIQAGLRIHMAPELVDVDTLAEAARVARQVPASGFAATLAATLGAPAELDEPAPSITPEPAGLSR
jgi:rSAM/selenodomain-associated transferase 1